MDAPPGPSDRDSTHSPRVLTLWPQIASITLALIIVLAPTVPTVAAGLSGGAEQPWVQPAPTQFEVAMFQTVQAVKEGREPDPALRRPDGTPGTLFEALLPDTLSEEVRAHYRRKLGERASSWRFFGANIPFLSGPTLAALNASFFRYSSVNPNSSVDWRSTIHITPIQMQFDSASCWVMAAADAVALAMGIATGTPSIPASVQQLCDCGGITCCQGGWPEDAFAWMVANGNITTAANYNYWAADGRNCTLQPNYPVAGRLTIKGGLGGLRAACPSSPRGLMPQRTAAW